MSIVSHVLTWQAGRPERAILFTGLGFLGMASLVLAALPAAAAAALLTSVLPLSSGGSGAALLEYHRLVFGAIAVCLLGSWLALPFLFGVLDRFLRWLESLDRKMLLVGLLLLVIAGRLVVVDRMLPIIPGQDTGHFYQLANTLLDEGRYIEYASHPGEPDGWRAWRPPGYPAALSVALLLTGRHPASVVLLNTFWMLVLVAGIYLLVRELASERAARFAALACALYPTLLAASLQALNVMQFASLFVLAVYLLYRQPWGARGVILGGVVLGLATLTRGNGLLLFLAFLVAFPVHHIFRSRRSRRPIREAVFLTGMLALGFSLPVAPWMVRHRLVLGEWVALATSGGANMWIGHHPGATGDPYREYNPEFPPAAGEVGISRYGARESLKYWVADPVANLRISARIVVRILKVDTGALPIIYGRTPESVSRGRGVYLSLLALFNLIYYGIWALIGLWAIAKALRRWPAETKPGILIALAALYVLTYVPFVGWARYKVPALPLLVAAACMVLTALASSEWEMQHGELRESKGRTGSSTSPRAQLESLA